MKAFVGKIKYCVSTVCAILFLGYLSSFGAETYRYVVAQDGSGDFVSIQKAIDACKAYPDQRITILVKNGTYREKIQVPACNRMLSIVGEEVTKTIIIWDDYFGKIDRGRNSTFYTYTLQVLADEFYMENITVENSAGPVGQAVALDVQSDKSVFRNCRFLGNQDTVYAAGLFSRQYFENCYIEGTTDFIFGEATVLFEACTLHCKANSYITAASTTGGKPFGFVFLNCKVTATSGVDTVYLGRPWRKFAKVAYICCELGAFIRPEGWDNWSNSENEKTALFSEFQNKGVGATIKKRVSWSKQLSANDAKNYVAEKIFAPFAWEEAGKNSWYLLCHKQ